MNEIPFPLAKHSAGQDKHNLGDVRRMTRYSYIKCMGKSFNKYSKHLSFQERWTMDMEDVCESNAIENINKLLHILCTGERDWARRSCLFRWYFKYLPKILFSANRFKTNQPSLRPKRFFAVSLFLSLCKPLSSLCDPQIDKCITYFVSQRMSCVVALFLIFLFLHL